ncbi:MAG: response regulator, partial [Burkholderiales bacterium]|nr:response regulator [Burkholderiales bacterium]
LLARTPLAIDAMEAASCETALELLRAHEFDCIMLDNQLGNERGSDLLPEIQRCWRRACPVIMVTGAGNESLAVQVLQEGAADYLTKYQLNPDVLLRAIRRALEHHRIQRELDELHASLEQRVEQQAAAIRQSERDLRAILDHTPAVIGYWDAALANRFGNHAWRRWLGVDPERLPGRALAEVLGPAQFARLAPRIEAVLRGESQFFEDDLPGRDGLRHAQVALHPDHGDDGRVRGFYSTINDVSAIKQAQARAEELAAFSETLFELSPVGLGVFDAGLRCVRCNRALAALIGGPEGELVGVELERMLVEDALPLLASARASLADGQSRRLEIDLHSLYGRHVQAACAWTRVEREGVGQVLLAAQDTTEQRAAHEALVGARIAAEEAARAKSDFLANMSHEIRTPMNAVLGLGALALQEDLPARARGFITKAHGAATALMGLLDDVLDYSKIEAGRLHLERVPLELEQLLQRAVDLFAARIEQKGLGFEVEIEPGLPPRVMGDPLRLSQVINNMLGNAVKFTERGSITLSVGRLDPNRPADALVRFAVRDTGIGVRAQEREALFEAFAQADSSITRRFGGTGLGLAICRRLVTAMHGSIGVESEFGRGSEFWFTARLEPDPGAAPAAVAPTLAGLRLLLAGPDGVLAPTLAAHLHSWPLEVEWVAEPAQALATAAARRAAGAGFDALLVDWSALADPGALVAGWREAAGDRAPLCALMAGHGAGVADASPRPDIVLAKPVLPAVLAAALASVPVFAAEHAGGAARPGEAAPGLIPAARPLAGLRVLVVEDNPTNLLVAELLLDKLGATAASAGDGIEALARLRADGPAFDLVLMDLHMPLMDGPEATARIRADPALARIPVVGMTAAVMHDERQRCLDAGMAGIVFKPIVVEELLEVLLRVCRPRG